MSISSFMLNGEECPFCSGNNLRKYSARANDSIPKGLVIQINECIDCLFAWQWPTKNCIDDSKVYFENAYMKKDKDSYFDPKKRKIISEMQLKFLTDLISKDKVDLLDIGSGDGTFLKLAAEYGWNALGVDPVQCDFHYDSPSSKGFAEMICGNIDDIPSGKKFDVITLWDVLEHVEQPIILLERSIELLTGEGMLIIETGNYQSGDRIVGNEWWWCYQLDHRWYFSPSVLKNILLELGLKRVKISSQTLRPWWNSEAQYIRPSIKRLIKKVIISPFRYNSIINNYFELKRAWHNWPWWVRNSIITIVATTD